MRRALAFVVVSRQPTVEPRSPAASSSLGDLLSRLVGEGKELVEVELARGRALAATRFPVIARAAALGVLAMMGALVALAALAAAAVLGLAAAGVAIGGALVIVGAVLIALAAATGFRVRVLVRRALRAAGEAARALPERITARERGLSGTPPRAVGTGSGRGESAR